MKHRVALVSGVLVPLIFACSGKVGALGTQTGGIPGANPTGNEPGMGTGAKTGRLLRRMSADQVRSTFKVLTGFANTGPAWVKDPNSPLGYRFKDDADLLEIAGPALGQPDYDLTVSENLEPGVSFSKFVEDAARQVCAKAARAEFASNGSGAEKHLLVTARPTDVLPTNEAAIRSNIVTLASRFWGVRLAPDSEEVNALLEVFRVASQTQATAEDAGPPRPAGGAVDGWRNVCIALSLDPQFYVY
jgi:hypothetical protein